MLFAAPSRVMVIELATEANSADFSIGIPSLINVSPAPVESTTYTFLGGMCVITEPFVTYAPLPPMVITTFFTPAR